ncbi:hypothetical protein ZEAMMB73_Zm00001d035286 [Zea mays]|uniref:Uncharacterized protein n=1 Tax=Zea mays TaxID=4577 RepID=A0A1D6LFB0_MAIZE|nr:hypothetical protein ZEAMMB73_Zm00001d035286 [Zea mays]
MLPLHMTLRCFDMIVRLLANKESRGPKGEIINNRKHYMDMRFWRMVSFGKLPKYHQDPTAEELAKTLDYWPSMNYYITGCRYVSMCSFRMMQRFLRRNFVIDLLSYEDNSCRYVIPANIQQRLIDIAKKD